jgi:cyclase
MALAHRIIPTILMTADGRMVKGQKFDGWRSTGMVMQAMRIHQLRGVDEVVLFDISATKEGREPQYELISKLASQCFFPLTVGGGVSKLEHIDKLLRAGADKVAICTEYSLIQEASERFGKQAIVGVVNDYDDMLYDHVLGEPYPVNSPIEWATILERMGVGEIIYQFVDRDGTMEGYDHAAIQALAEKINVPLVCSGGCRDYGDMEQALQAGADAVAAGALFQFADATPQAAASYLYERGWEVRHVHRVG